MRIVIAMLVISISMAGQPMAAQVRVDDGLVVPARVAITQQVVSGERCAKAAARGPTPVVRLTLVTGAELKGRVIARAEPDVYTLCDVHVMRGEFSVPGAYGAPATITRSQVHSVAEIDGLRYPNADAIDASIVRAVAELTRRDTRITIKTRNGLQMRGRITSINETHFTLTGGATSSVVAYDDVVEVRPAKLHWTWTLGFLTAAAAGGVLILTVLQCGQGGC